MFLLLLSILNNKSHLLCIILSETFTYNMRERVKRASAQNHRVFSAINTGVANVGGRKQCTARHPAGRREDPGLGSSRAACGAPVHRTEPGSLLQNRTAPGRHTYGLLTGALRFQSTNFHRTPPGRRRICDHTRRRNENRKGPVRSLKSTASRRVGKIVRGPVDMWPRH